VDPLNDNGRKEHDSFQRRVRDVLRRKYDDTFHTISQISEVIEAVKKSAI
jgi:hypothetical protein